MKLTHEIQRETRINKTSGKTVVFEVISVFYLTKVTNNHKKRKTRPLKETFPLSLCKNGKILIYRL